MSGVAQGYDMDSKSIHKVSVWFDRMCLNAHRAAQLASQLQPSDLHEDNHLFWALAKYAENVTESIKQLDNLNKTILPLLVEIPVDSEVEGDATWKDLKGMRDRLSHQFWNIDPDILRETAIKDFPKLVEFLSTVRVVSTPIKKGQIFSTGSFQGSELLNLPEVKLEEGPKPGNSLVNLWFDEEDGACQVFRIGRHPERMKLALWCSVPDVSVQLFRMN